MKHSHYRKDVSHLKTLDVYRVLDLFNVTNPALQHAAKKILCAGERGAKGRKQDLQEAVDSINRALEMMDEDMTGIDALCDRLQSHRTRQKEWAGVDGQPTHLNPLEALKCRHSI